MHFSFPACQPFNPALHLQSNLIITKYYVSLPDPVTSAAAAIFLQKRLNSATLPNPNSRKEKCCVKLFCLRHYFLWRVPLSRSFLGGCPTPQTAEHPQYPPASSADVKKKRKASVKTSVFPVPAPSPFSGF